MVIRNIFIRNKLVSRNFLRITEPFYKINLLLDKELLQIKKMTKLGVSEHEIVEIGKKGDFRFIFFDQFCDLTLSLSPSSTTFPFFACRVVMFSHLFSFFRHLNCKKVFYDCLPNVYPSYIAVNS